MRTVSNARLAELAAELAGLTNADGSIRWDELEREFPYLFRPATPPGHAGAGTGAGAPDARPRSMSHWIRAQARGT